jgi:preprotein translocase subunit SecA
MTGTASTEAEEFEKIYNLEVVPIPTHREMIRLDYEDLVYATEEAKFKAIVDEIKARKERGQPVLIGTVAIETSERLSKALKNAKIDHQVLNAKQHEREAEIITQAGRLNAVTIATNMAGRGVDILLGGNPEGMAREKLRRQGIDITQATPEQWEAAFSEAQAEAERDRKKVVELGGLCVIGTERHEARRIDNQLRGRAGRQGDPGESRFFLSLEDDLMRRFGGDRVKGIMNWAKLPEDEPIEHPWVSKAIAQAQVRVEGINFDIRKRVLEYDDVVNKQREVIYRQRREVLTQDNLREQYLQTLEAEIGKLVDQHCEDEGDPDSWELGPLYQALLGIFPVPNSVTPETMAGKSLDDLEEMLVEALHEAYDRKTEELTPEIMRRAERVIMLNAIDTHWRRHLTDLDILREGIGLVAMAQRDPLVEYKREAFAMWQSLQDEIKDTAGRNIFRVQVSAPMSPVRRAVPTLQQLAQTPQGQAVRPVVATAAPAGVAASAGGQVAAAEPARKATSIGRNDPCWCGSGKKYKHCHLKADQGGA